MSRGEQARYQHAMIAAETMCGLYELQILSGEIDLDAKLKRLKDLGEYALENADILDRREGVEMLAIAMLFGMSSNSAYAKNYTRLSEVSAETLSYKGDGDTIKKQIKRREAKAKQREKKKRPKKKKSGYQQKRLF